MSRRLYIVHGWAYSIDPWEETVSLLRKQNIDVVQLRVPGLTAPSKDVWTIDDYVNWLEQQLENDPHPAVLGHSNGGRIALHFASKFPDRLSQLLLLNSAGIEIDSAQLSLKRKLFANLSNVLAPLKRIPLAKKIVYRLLGSDYGSAPANMQTTLANMLASDSDFDPSTITTPTSILWGRDDHVTPPTMGRILHAAIKGSSLDVIDNWAHAPYRTHPSELAEHIARVLREQQ